DLRLRRRAGPAVGASRVAAPSNGLTTRANSCRTRPGLDCGYHSGHLMATHDIVTIGASAGGVQTLGRLLEHLPADLPAAIMMVLHLHPQSPSILDHLLSRCSKLPVRFARDDDAIDHGQVDIAPRDNHLLVEPGRLRVVRGPRENRHRPAVDPLFRSAAWAYGPRVVGVVFTATLDDGASGLWAIRSCGGTTVVQDPDDPLHAEMPTSALTTLNVDHCLSLPAIAHL